MVLCGFGLWYAASTQFDARDWTKLKRDLADLAEFARIVWPAFAIVGGFGLCVIALADWLCGDKGDA